MFQYIEPEVSGGLGKDTKMDASVHPPNIYNLHYEFSGWLGNDMLESFPCYIVTAQLRKEIESRTLTGIEFSSLKITVTEEFQELYPNRELPTFYWMKIKGEVGKDDFGIAEDLRLVVSEKAQEVLKLFNLSEAIFEDYGKP